jgi:hypothetical protein
VAKWALFLHAAATNERDPVFGKSVAFICSRCPFINNSRRG